MNIRLLFVFVAAAALAGCGLSDQQKADYASVQRSGVSPAIYDKMAHGDPLSIGDVIAMSRAGVSDGVITRYIRDQGTVYVLSSSDFDRMQKGGVSRSVIDYMAHSNVYRGPWGGGPYGSGPYPYDYPYGPPVSIGVGVGVGGGHWH